MIIIIIPKFKFLKLFLSLNWKFIYILNPNQTTKSWKKKRNYAKIYFTKI